MAPPHAFPDAVEPYVDRDVKEYIQTLSSATTPDDDPKLLRWRKRKWEALSSEFAVQLTSESNEGVVLSVWREVGFSF